MAHWFKKVKILELNCPFYGYWPLYSTILLFLGLRYKYLLLYIVTRALFSELEFKKFALPELKLDNENTQSKNVNNILKLLQDVFFHLKISSNVEIKPTF